MKSQPCVACGKMTHLVCNECNTSRYCGVKCRNADRESHKLECLTRQQVRKFAPAWKDYCVYDLWLLFNHEKEESVREWWVNWLQCLTQEDQADAIRSHLRQCAALEHSTSSSSTSISTSQPLHSSPVDPPPPPPPQEDPGPSTSTSGVGQVTSSSSSTGDAAGIGDAMRAAETLSRKLNLDPLAVQELFLYVTLPAVRDRLIAQLQELPLDCHADAVKNFLDHQNTFAQPRTSLEVKFPKGYSI